LSTSTIVLAKRGPAQLGGERDKTAENLPLSERSAFTVGQAGGMGHILSWGGSGRGQTPSRRGMLPRANCCVSF